MKGQMQIIILKQTLINKLVIDACIIQYVIHHNVFLKVRKKNECYINVTNHHILFVWIDKNLISWIHLFTIQSI